MNFFAHALFLWREAWSNSALLIFFGEIITDPLRAKITKKITKNIITGGRAFVFSFTRRAPQKITSHEKKMVKNSSSDSARSTPTALSIVKERRTVVRENKKKMGRKIQNVRAILGALQEEKSAFTIRIEALTSKVESLVSDVVDECARFENAIRDVPIFAAPPLGMDKDDLDLTETQQNCLRIMQENAVLHAARANRMFYHKIVTFMESVVEKNSWCQLRNANVPYYPIAADFRYGQATTLPYINFKGSDGKLYRILVHRNNSRHQKVVCVLLNAARYDELLRKAKEEKKPRWYQQEDCILIDEQKMDFVLSGGGVAYHYRSQQDEVKFKFWNPIEYDSIETAVNDVFDVLDPMITSYEVTDSKSDFGMVYSDFEVDSEKESDGDGYSTSSWESEPATDEEEEEEEEE